MKAKFCFAVPLVLLLISLPLKAQTPAPTEPAVTIISFKIARDYYPMLDGKSSGMSADNGEIPMSDAEIFARNNTTNARRSRTANAVGMNDEKRSRGRLHTTIQIIDNADSVNLTIRNLSTKTIKAIVWDFAFPRMEAGKLLLRYEAISPAEIKPGGKKSLKQPLPAGASRCKVINAATAPVDKALATESLCGRGIHDPSQLPQKQEPVTIKRIDYADGSVWQP